MGAGEPVLRGACTGLPCGEGGAVSEAAARGGGGGEQGCCEIAAGVTQDSRAACLLPTRVLPCPAAAMHPAAGRCTAVTHQLQGALGQPGHAAWRCSGGILRAQHNTIQQGQAAASAAGAGSPQASRGLQALSTAQHHAWLAGVEQAQRLVKHAQARHDGLVKRPDACLCW
jgi:hypothetical protein